MLMQEVLERYRPKRFDEVLGQNRLVCTLGGRVITMDHRHIVLHGAEGSGKMTVARLYAQALQCAAPALNGSPCQRCTHCMAFDPCGTFNYLEIDAKIHGDTEHARYLLRRLRGLMIADRSTMVVQNADRLSDFAADVLLKTVEDRSATTTFIFVLDQVSALHPALRSRTQAFRLQPLADKVAVNRLVAVC